LYQSLATTNILTASWTQFVASLGWSCCAVEVFNPSPATIQLSTGTAGNESTAIVPYTILPGGSSILLPLEIKSGTRLSLKAVDQIANTGYFIMNFFG